MGIFDKFFKRNNDESHSMESLGVKSNLIKENWELMESTYVKAYQEYSRIKNETNELREWKNKSLLNLLKDEFKKLYPVFVLEPIKNDVFELFKRVQNQDYEKEKSIIEKINLFHVSYYTVQYFRISIAPLQSLINEEYKDFPILKIKTNNENLLLNDIFEELWEEMIDDDEPWYDIVNDDFYDIEVQMLGDFLSGCWNESKLETNSDLKSILSEMSGVGETYLLDENRALHTGELQSLITESK